jgi:RNase P/RNase MRP subunit p30
VGRRHAIIKKATNNWIAIELGLADALQDHSVMFVAKPKSGLSQIIELRAHCV